MVTRRQEGATDVAEATERSPSTVPARAIPDGETPGRYAWVEPTIWTPRMVQALQNGVKGGRWYSVIDKVLTLRSLEAAFARVKANKGGVGVDHMTIEASDLLTRPLSPVQSRRATEGLARQKSPVLSIGHPAEKPKWIPSNRHRPEDTIF